MPIQSRLLFSRFQLFSDFNIEGSRNKLGNLPVNDEDLDRQEIPRKARDIAKSRQNIGRKQIKDKKKKNRKIKVATGLYFAFFSHCLTHS